MKIPEWDELGSYYRSKFISQAIELIEKGYIHDATLSEEDVAKKLYKAFITKKGAIV